MLWDSTGDDVRGPKIVRRPNPRGLYLPRGVASDGKRLFVSDCDNHRVLVFETAGPPAIAVLGQPDFESWKPNRGGHRGPDTMLFPGSLALDRSMSRLLVADGMNGRVLIFDVSREIDSGTPAIAVVPLPGTVENPPPEQPRRRRIAGAVDVTIDGEDRIFVADRERRRVLTYNLADVLAGRREPVAAMGKSR